MKLLYKDKWTKLWFSLTRVFLFCSSPINYMGIGFGCVGLQVQKRNNSQTRIMLIIGTISICSLHEFRNRFGNDLSDCLYFRLLVWRLWPKPWALFLQYGKKISQNCYDYQYGSNPVYHSHVNGMNSFMIEPTKTSGENSAKTSNQNETPRKPIGLRAAIQQASTDDAERAGNDAIDSDSNFGRKTSELDDYGLQLLLTGAVVGFAFGIVYCPIIWGK